jgi:hypothetical protein
MSDSETDILKLYSPEELTPDDLPPEELLKLIKKEKKVPATTSIVATPSNINELDEKNDIDLLVLFTSLYSTKLVHKYKPEWNLDENDTPIFLNMKANSFAKIIEGPFMSSILQKESYVEDDVDDDLTFAGAHIENLKKLFSGFPQYILTQLDSILTGVAKQLAELNTAKWREHERHLNSYVCYYFFEEQSMQPKLRTFYFNIEIKTFKVFISVGKFKPPKEEEKKRFVMKYFDSINNINAAQMDRNRKFINEMIDKWTK